MADRRRITQGGVRRECLEGMIHEVPRTGTPKQEVIVLNREENPWLEQAVGRLDFKYYSSQVKVGLCYVAK